MSARNKITSAVLITPHAAVRALQRGVSLKMIDKALQSGKAVYVWPNGVYKFTAKWNRDKITVVLNKEQNVIITCYRNRQPKPKWQ